MFVFFYVGKTILNHPQITIDRWYGYHSQSWLVYCFTISMEVLMGNSLERPWEHWSLWMEVLKAFQIRKKNQEKIIDIKLGKLWEIAHEMMEITIGKITCKLGIFQPCLVDGIDDWWMFIMFNQLWSIPEIYWHMIPKKHKEQSKTDDSSLEAKVQGCVQSSCWHIYWVLQKTMTWSQVADCTRSFFSHSARNLPLWSMFRVTKLSTTERNDQELGTWCLTPFNTWIITCYNPSCKWVLPPTYPTYNIL